MVKACDLQIKAQEAWIPAMFSAPAISLFGVLIEISERNGAILWYSVASGLLGLLLVFKFLLFSVSDL